MRPKRTIQRATYKEESDSDLEGSNHSNSTSELTDIKTDDEIHYPTIHLPTASEAAETEHLILVTAGELEAVDAEHRELKRRLDSVERKRNTMMDRFLGLKARLARIRTLPQEVLGYIFTFYMDDPAHSPWTLMQVTRTWRATALSTRVLWTKIMITSPAWQKSGSSRRKDGREVCGSTQQLDMALQRAGNESLDIQILLKGPSNYKYRKYSGKAVSAMINSLVSSRRCLKVHHLQIHGNDYSGLYREPSQEPLEFPELRTFYVTSLLCAEFTVKLSSPLRRLTKMSLPVPPYWKRDVATQFFEAMKRWLQIPTLAALSLEGRGFDDATLQELYEALTNAKHITTLELNDIYRREDVVVPVPVLRLPNLHTLALKKGFRHWAFDTPRLVNLTMEGKVVIPQGPAASNQFPLLSSMNIVYDWTTMDYLDHIYFPSLHTLDLSFTRKSFEPSDIMTRRIDLNPVVLRIRKAKFSTNTLTSWLVSMDLLEELVLEEIDVNYSLFDFLASYKMESSDLESSSVANESQLHCPRLVRLQVDLKGGSPAQHRKTKKAAKRAIKSRTTAGINVEKWMVRSPADRGA